MADKQAIDSNLGIKEVELRDGENKLIERKKKGLKMKKLLITLFILFQ